MIRTLVNISLLCSAIVLISRGIYEHNLIMILLGGFCTGVYNYMIENK